MVMTCVSGNDENNSNAALTLPSSPFSPSHFDPDGPLFLFSSFFLPLGLRA